MHDAPARIAAALLLAGLSACAPRVVAPAPQVRVHREPATEAPAATLEVRVLHAARPGDLFGDRVEIDGRPALGANDHDGRVRGEIRVAPGRRRVRLSTTAFDESTRTAIGYTHVPVHFTGTVHGGQREARFVSMHGEIPIPYLYEAADIEPTLACRVDVPLRAAPGARYVVDYLVRADGTCAARCRRADGAGCE